MSFEWGVWFEPTQPVARLVSLAQRAEQLGATVCFIADEGTERDVYVALTAVLLQTRSMTVAPAITNPFSRHPVTTAAAIATLEELAPGRVWNGLGVGGSRVLSPLGLAPDKPFTALADAVHTTGELIAGNAVGPAVIPWSKQTVPLAIAGRGPRVQRLAAEAADWVIFSAKPRLHLGQETARVRAQGGARIAWSAYVAWSDVERSRALRHFSYMAVDAPPDIRAAAGLDDARMEAVRSAMLGGRMDEAASLLPAAMVDQYGVAGTVEQCAVDIAEQAPNFDLFMLPMNDEATCETHIDTCAAILAEAQRLAAAA
jgi:5,10-methylenetetrahydromethanopterin reductase